jgi:crotonobetainyl-CoA:carnitine CoA-transferase CaiB-like acyl-CoA transferase
MLEKTKTGNGKFVEVSLIQAAISSLANQASNWLVAKRLPQKQGSAHPNIAPYGEIFRTADGKEILLAIGSDKQFKDLCGILSLAHLSDNRLFSTNYSRVQNREELNQLISTRVSVVSSSVLLKEIHDKKIPAGVIQNIQQVFDMPEAQPLLISSGDLQGVRTFVATNESHTRALLPPPHFGEHTESILKNLAF